MIIGLLGSLINNENLGCLALTYSQIALIEKIAMEEKISICYYVFEPSPDIKKTETAEKSLGLCKGSITSYDVTPLFRFRRFVRSGFGS